MQDNDTSAFCTGGEDALLALMSAELFNRFTVGHLQKMMYVLEREVGDVIGGPFFEYENEAYGPSSPALGSVLGSMVVTRLLRTDTRSGTRDLTEYSLTRAGFARGSEILSRFSDTTADYIRKLNAWGAGTDFSVLVGSVVRRYTETGSNLLFSHKAG